MPEILLIGPGAIGGMIAARLCQNPGNAVSIAARTPFAVLQLETADGLLEATPRLLSEPGDTGPVDWILVATKAYDSRAAARWFDMALGELSHVAVLQNGVNHVERFSAWVAKDRILPVIVDCPTERVAPGRIRQRGVSRLTLPDNSLARNFVQLFEETGVDCRVNDDFTTAAWWKLCLNAAGVVNALALLPAGIAHNESAAFLMRRIVDETAAVGRAEGARLSDDIADEIVDIYRRHPADSVNSLHADRAAGRPMEIDLRNGVIVDLGRKHGIATPYNEMAVALLKIE